MAALSRANCHPVIFRTCCVSDGEHLLNEFLLFWVTSCEVHVPLGTIRFFLKFKIKFIQLLTFENPNLLHHRSRPITPSLQEPSLPKKLKSLRPSISLISVKQIPTKTNLYSLRPIKSWIYRHRSFKSVISPRPKSFKCCLYVILSTNTCV